MKLVKWRQVCPDFLVRTLRISQDSAERTVCQFHYTTWPDHGVPPHVQPILELVRLMRDVQPTEARPILVHCSAGCGRTGTICSIDYVWALLRTGKLDEDFCLYDILVDMRKQRIAMVQTYEQYVLCYHAVAALFEQQLKIIDAHTYENLDEDGHPLLFRSINDCARNSSSSEPESCDELDGIETFPSPNEQSKISLTDDCKAMACARTSPAPESSKQEKLVGKATVIRRPSIAKLKAMFENVNIVEQPSERPLLQRSHSTRERSTTGMHPARVVRTDDLALVRQQHAAVVNEVQALCSTVEREQTPSDQNTEESDPVNNIAFDAELPIYGTNVDLEPQPIYAYRPPMRVATNVPTVSMKEIFHPPPKPPRTYQYHIIAPNGSRAQSNTVGRIIYTIAPPQPNYTTVDDSRIAMQRQYHQRHASTPNIAAAVLTMPMNNLPADMRKTLEYEDVKKMRAAQAASSHAINREPIYQPIARNHPMRVEPIYQTMSMPKDAMLNPYSVPQYIAQAERRKLGGDKVVPIQRKDIQVIQRPLSSYEGVYDIPKNYSLGDMSRQDPQNYAKYVTVPHNAKQARNVRPPEHSKVNVKVEESALQSETRTSNDKAATSKSDAKKLKGKETKSHMEPKKNSSFSLPFFGKSKSKQKSKTEKQQQANSPAPKPNSSNAAKANTGEYTKMINFKANLSLL